MATQVLNATFDGVTAVDRLAEQSSVAWYESGERTVIDRYSVYVEQPDDLDATLNLSGSNWRVRMLQVAGDDHITRIVDLDNGTGREIEYLNLGLNSEVDLTSTKVRYMNGWEGQLHDITLGPQNDWMHWINLGADVNKLDTAVGYVGGIDIYDGRANITVRGETGGINMTGSNDRLVVDGGNVASVSMQGGDDTVIVKNGGRIKFIEDFGGNADITVLKDSRLDSFRGGEGDVDITLKGTGRVESVRVFTGDFTFSSEKSYVQSIYGWQVDANVKIGTGGAGTIQLGSDTTQSHKITGSASGYIDVISTVDSGSNQNDDQSAVIKTSYYVGAIHTGNGKDVVTTGEGETGYVGSIGTSGGNDVVNLGSGGANIVSLSRGNDLIRVKELFYKDADEELIIRGGAGNDSLNFSSFSVGVTLSLEIAGAVQEVAKDAGFFSVLGMENLTGSQKADALTGSNANNEIKGLGGNDKLWGLDGNDKLDGGNGNDKIYGGKDKDTLIGGKGKDILDGGKGNDTLNGGDGADIFVFGKNSGTDKVKDFADGTDILRIADHTGGFGELSFANQGENLKITHDGGVILLLDKAETTLTSADFDFV